MVLHKRLDYGFSGYQVLVIPRAPRSARRRRLFTKKVNDNQMCAFDLLATVAGKLLLETESNPMFSDASTQKDNCTTKIVENVVKKEHQDGGEPLKIEPYDKKYGLKESQHSQNDAHSGLSSALTGSESSERVSAEKMEIDGSITRMIGCKVEGGSAAYLDTDDCKLESEVKIPLKSEPHSMPIDVRADMCSLENPVVCDGKPAAGASSDSSSKGPSYKEQVPCHSYKPSRYDVNLVGRDDDDENSSGCTHPSKATGCTHGNPKTRFFRPSLRVGDRRIRKLLASRYWKVAPKSKIEDLQNTVFPDREKSAYCNRKNCYKHQISQRNYPFKKRQIFYHSSISNSNIGVDNDGISNLLRKDINGDVHAATGKSSSVAGQHSSFQCRDSHVKLRIQSFRVPELFIEIPETATVGSLKRTVMEAVNAILGGGLHVGLLLQGKKIRDDHKTLQQTGISRDKHLEALGFTLEPTLSQVSPHLGSEDPPSDTPQPLTSLGNFVESDHDSAPSPIDSSIDKNTADSKALVALPAMGVEASLSMVHKSKRAEIAQRRIRRPFSVTEVEALVQAVEKLGTGRWRDVKMRAFENAKHRTYVDLKDKWKTLVHTARISPQQRRGEAVPQELLDRVLAAHAHWIKQHIKQQQHLSSD